MTAPAPAPVGVEPPAPIADAAPDDPTGDARRLMARLDDLGLRASGPWETGPALMAVSAQCVRVEPYVGRTVWLLPPPGRVQARATGLFWHWQRPHRDQHGHPVGRWFQPFCPATDPDRAAAAIHAAIHADIRNRTGNADG